MKCDTIPAMEKFLQIQEQALGAGAPEVATTVSRLADLYFKISRFEKAEALYRRALDIREQIVGVHADEVEESRQNLARVLEARTAATGSVHQPSIAITDSIAAGASESATTVAAHGVSGAPGRAHQSKTSDSGVRFEAMPEGKEQIQQRVRQTKMLNDAISDLESELELLRQMVGVDHPSVADLLTKLADLYCRLRLYAQMEPVLIEALKIRESACGSDHPSVSTELKNLARLYVAQERYNLAEPLFRRALSIREKAFGRTHPRVADIEEHYAQLLRRTNRLHQAEALEKHVNEIRNQQFAEGQEQQRSLFNGIGK